MTDRVASLSIYGRYQNLRAPILYFSNYILRFIYTLRILFALVSWASVKEGLAYSGLPHVSTLCLLGAMERASRLKREVRDPRRLFFLLFSLFYI